MDIIREHGSFIPDPYQNKLFKAIFTPGKVRFVEDSDGKFWGIWQPYKLPGGRVVEPKTGPFLTLDGAQAHSIAAMA